MIELLNWFTATDEKSMFFGSILMMLIWAAWSIADNLCDALLRIRKR